jgi:hypothetical protein
LVVVSQENKSIKNLGFFAAKGIILAFQKREIGDSQPQASGAYLIYAGFDMGEATGLRIGYAEVICH